VTQDRLVRIENRELFQEFFRFPQSVGLLDEDDVATYGARYGGNEFNNRLVRQANRVFEDAAPENPGCDLLLVGKAAIKPVDEDVVSTRAATPVEVLSSPTSFARPRRRTSAVAFGCLVEQTEL